MATILVVDDRIINREYLVTLLGYSGHRVHEAGGGAEALALTRAVRPELVIADILMPLMDGYEFVRLLRADPAIAATPVIFYTAAYLEREARALALKCGVTNLLTMPIEPRAILLTIDEVLAQARAPAAAEASEEIDRQHLRLLTDTLVAKVGELEAANQRLAALIDLGRSLALERDPRRLLEKYGQAGREVIGARSAFLGVLNEDGKSFEIILASGFNVEDPGRTGSPSPRQGVIGQVLTEGRPIRVLVADGADPVIEVWLHGPRVRSFLGVPLATPARLYGLLGFAEKADRDAFSAEDEGLAATMATQLALAYENAKRHEEIEQHAAELEVEVIERRRAETTARESEERLRQLAENIREVFWLLDMESDRLLFVSSAYKTIWGRPLADLDAGRGAWVEGIHPQDRDRVLQAIRTKAARGEYSEEYRIVRPDGAERWIRDRAFPVQAEPGRGLRIAGIAEDVTERKQAEQAAHDRAERLRAVVETAGDGIITIDAQGQIDSFNPAAKTMFGYSVQEAIGQNVNLLMPAPYREQHDGFLSHYLNTGEKKIIGGGAREVVGKRKNGSTFPLELTVTEMSVGGNRMFTGMLRDITERKQAQTLLGLRADELARSNNELEQFAYIASHDLQEPLRMVASYLGLLAERYAGHLDDRADKYINYAVDGAVRMKALIDDLLSLSRVTTQGKPLVLMEAQAALDEALVNLSTTIRERGAIVTSDNLPRVLADPIQMVRLFQNLIGNAIKFCENKRPTVHVLAERVGDEWVLSVQDNGIGVAPQQQERIFQIFKRLHERDRYAGTGIGLAICKKVVERHGGRIWVESRPNEGSTFLFSLPVKVPSSHDETNVKRTEVTSAPACSSPRIGLASKES